MNNFNKDLNQQHQPYNFSQQVRNHHQNIADQGISRDELQGQQRKTFSELLIIIFIFLIVNWILISIFFGDKTTNFTNWNGYVHGSMKWGKVDNLIMQNPLTHKMGPLYIRVEFEGQMYLNRPHGVGTIKCKNSSADICPIESASVQFMNGKLHEGPMFFNLVNGRKVVFEQILEDVPLKVSILYEQEGMMDLFTDKNKQEDVSGIVREIRQHLKSYDYENYKTKVIQYQEQSGVLLIGTELDQVKIAKMQEYELGFRVYVRKQIQYPESSKL
ncbi:hypothetical protein FGO68_gene3532 [Halteria grandinella]|uniref:Transmembrane protein n=1 Tax=Halteria grandinella TaxID=5974 RepID=A0A8J8T5W0_HALGN|nr:hypothetical protein FGO68_gene3532 [Halteria grandinella]